MGGCVCVYVCVCVCLRARASVSVCVCESVFLAVVYLYEVLSLNETFQVFSRELICQVSVSNAHFLKSAFILFLDCLLVCFKLFGSLLTLFLIVTVLLLQY